MEYIKKFNKGDNKPVIIAMGSDFKLLKRKDNYYLMAKEKKAYKPMKSMRGVLVLTKKEVSKYRINTSGIATFNSNACKVWREGIITLNWL